MFAFNRDRGKLKSPIYLTSFVTFALVWRSTLFQSTALDVLALLRRPGWPSPMPPVWQVVGPADLMAEHGYSRLKTKRTKLEPPFWRSGSFFKTRVFIEVWVREDEDHHNQARHTQAATNWSIRVGLVSATCAEPRDETQGHLRCLGWAGRRALLGTARSQNEDSTLFFLPNKGISWKKSLLWL